MEERARLREVGEDLAERLEGSWTLRAIETTSLELWRGRPVLELSLDRQKVAVSVFGDSEPTVWVAGRRTDESELAAIASCVELEAARLTVRRMKLGDRYRVAQDTQALRAGSIVRFVGFDDVDNHFGRLMFEDESGTQRIVEGDFASERSPVAQVHRYLRALE